MVLLAKVVCVCYLKRTNTGSTGNGGHPKTNLSRICPLVSGVPTLAGLEHLQTGVSVRFHHDPTYSVSKTLAGWCEPDPTGKPPKTAFWNTCRVVSQHTLTHLKQYVKHLHGGVQGRIGTRNNATKTLAAWCFRRFRRLHTFRANTCRVVCEHVFTILVWL